ncbi:hypothetical protein [Streptosporangium sp. NPDC006007]|uniref:hypothetical protein n=1 Tax=Streptosporangium sp. NPDC006007 TaxID=3154575 RepID=UPI0033B759CD
MPPHPAVQRMVDDVRVQDRSAALRPDAAAMREGFRDAGEGYADALAEDGGRVEVVRHHRLINGFFGPSVIEPGEARDAHDQVVAAPRSASAIRRR